MNRRHVAGAGRSAGVALPTVLMFLVILLVIGIFGAKRAVFDEGLSRNQLDYNIARQAAEAALRDGERDFLLGSTPATGAPCSRGAARPLDIEKFSSAYFGTTCPQGQCRFENTYYAKSTYPATSKDTPVNPMPWWPSAKGGIWGDDVSVKPVKATANTNCSFTGAVPLGTFTATPAFAGVARQPEYFLEYLIRGDERVVRITARGFGADINTEVVMQSYFKVLTE